MRLKISLILILLSFAFTVLAADIIALPNYQLKESFFSKIWRCKWRVSCYFEKPLGATITTINATDLISASRATINTNFSNLNSGKIEVGTTSVASITTLGGLTSASSLATLGTITTGIWSAGAIAVGKGGTGTTSPSQYLVMLGNGSGGLTGASSTGSSGQFLTSNGSGAYPSWQTSSVNQGDNYLWTATHNFTGTTLIKNLNASSTSANPIKLNGVSYNTPAADGASSTVLMTNGSGTLTWNKFRGYLNSSTTPSTYTSVGATTLTSFTLDSGTLLGNVLHTTIIWTGTISASSNGFPIQFYFTYGSTNSLEVSIEKDDAGTLAVEGQVDMWLIATSTANQKALVSMSVCSGAGADISAPNKCAFDTSAVYMPENSANALTYAVKLNENTTGHIVTIQSIVSIIE